MICNRRCLWSQLTCSPQFLGLSPIIAPVKCSILPLVNNERLTPFIGQIGAHALVLAIVWSNTRQRLC